MHDTDALRQKVNDASVDGADGMDGPYEGSVADLDALPAEELTWEEVVELVMLLLTVVLVQAAAVAVAGPMVADSSAY